VISDAALLTSNRGDITPKDIRDACRALGLGPGDIVMVHARLFTLGRTAHGVGKEQLADAFIEAVLQAVGREGLVVFPTFTLSACKSGIFDVNETKSEMGLLSERARTRSDSSRTHHPFFSVSVIGDRKDLFSAIKLDTCFGENSIFDILHKRNETGEHKGKVKFLTFGIDLPPEAVTYIHSIEEKLAVSYRYQKHFQGIIRAATTTTSYDVQFFVRDLTTEVIFDAEACWELLRSEEGVKTQPLGDSFVTMLPEATIYSALVRKITQQSDFLCKGGYKKS
jgi:aminoglycoside 3-N-acetyltransferase